MKLLPPVGVAALLAASLWSVDAKNEPLEPTPPDEKEAAAVLTDDEPTKTLRDVFTPVAPSEPIVTDIVSRFQTLYAEEMSRSSLLANVSSILKAERTGVRGEMMEKELDTGGLGIDFMEETQSQLYRIFLLIKYQFDSSMLGHTSPHVTVMRLTMDCYNVSNEALATEEQQAEGEFDSAPTPPVQLACDVLEHIDLPRRNESTKSIPPYIQRQIFHSAPPSYIHNHSLHVFYDAFEAQDLAFDAHDKPVANRDTMHYVRFRVQGGNAKDCVVAIEHADGINTLRYQDTVCYDNADADAAAALAASGPRGVVSSANAPAFVLLAAIFGACVAALLVWRQRTRQRSGYSYVSSNTSKLSHVPAPSPTAGTTNADAAVAC